MNNVIWNLQEKGPEKIKTFILAKRFCPGGVSIQVESYNCDKWVILRKERKTKYYLVNRSGARRIYSSDKKAKQIAKAIADAERLARAQRGIEREQKTQKSKLSKAAKA